MRQRKLHLNRSVNAAVTRLATALATGIVSALAVSTAAYAVPTPLPTPAPPSISQASTTSILVNYTPFAAMGASTIKLYDTTSGAPPLTTNDSTGSSTFTGLTVHDTYHATITSLGDNITTSDSAESANSNVVILTPPQLAQPSAPSLAQISPSSLRVTFSPDGNASSSTITLFDTNLNTSTSNSVSGSTTSSTFTGQTTGHAYRATITSIGDGTTFSSSVESSSSNTVTLTLTQLSKPPPPVISQASTTSIAVSYTPAPNASASLIGLRDVTASTSTSFSDTTGGHTFTGLTVGHVYHATIISEGDGITYSDSAASAASNSVRLTAPKLPTPAAPVVNIVTPTILIVTYTPDSLASSSTITLYDTTASTSTSSNITTGSHSFTGLTTGHTYRATITSVGDGINYATSLESAFSNSITLTVPPLATPLVTSTTPEITSVAIHFAAIANAVSYTATVLHGAAVLFTNSSCTPASCDFVGLAEGTSYTVQVQAISNHGTAGDSAPSAPVTFKTFSTGVCGPSSVPAPASPPPGVAASSLGTPMSCSTGATSATTLKLTTPNTTSTYLVPLGALPVGTVVSAYPITSITSLANLVPKGHSYVVAVALAWQAPDGSTPVATLPITLTIRDASIVAGDSVTRLSSTGLVTVGTAVTKGAITITFTTDPIIVVTAIAKRPQATLMVRAATARVGKEIPLSTRGGSGSGAVAFSVLDGSATGCKVSSSNPPRLTSASYGTCRVTALKAADVSHGAVSATAVTMTFAPNPQRPLRLNSTKGRVGKALVLTISGGSGSGALRFRVRNGTSAGCALGALRPVTLRASNPGSCLVEVVKSGDASFGPMASATTAVLFVRVKVPGPVVAATTGVVKSGTQSTLFISGSGFGVGTHVSSTTGGVSLSVLSSTPTSIVVSINVAKSVASGPHQLTVSNRNGTALTTYRVVKPRVQINVAALVTGLLAGYRQAWASSPAAGIAYAFAHDYPGSATTLSAFLACNQKVGAGQTGETDTPQLGTLRADPAWRGSGPDTRTWNFAGKKPSGATYSVTDAETTKFAGGSTQNYQKVIHITILSGTAYFYFTPAC